MAIGTASRGLLLAIVVALAGCGSDGPTEIYDPISGACDACLSDASDAGCGDPGDACFADADCEAYGLCQLQNGCYRTRPASGCEDEVGCVAPSDAESRMLADAYETCARTTCAEPCGFAAPDA